MLKPKRAPAKKTKAPQTWDDFPDLSNRARQAIRNYPQSFPSPDGVREATQFDYNATVNRMLTLPRVGRQTVTEILDTLEIVRPVLGIPQPRLSKFMNEGELLLFLGTDNELDATKLERGSIALALGMVARGELTVVDGKLRTTEAGVCLIEQYRGRERVTMTISGTRDQLRDMVHCLPDKFAYLDCLEDGIQTLATETKVEVVLSS